MQKYSVTYFPKMILILGYFNTICTFYFRNVKTKIKQVINVKFVGIPYVEDDLNQIKWQHEVLN